MYKYAVVLNCSARTKIYFYAESVSIDEMYSVNIDGNIVTFEYPVASIESVPEDINPKKRYVLHFEDGKSREVVCVNGNYNPEDPYTFLHGGDSYEFEKPITGVEIFAFTERSRKDGVERVIKASEVVSERSKHNTPVQCVRHFFRPEEVDVFLDGLYQHAIEKKLWHEAITLNYIRKDERVKYSRKVLSVINTVEDYDEIIDVLTETSFERRGFPIDEFWQRFHQMM